MRTPGQRSEKAQYAPARGKSYKALAAAVAYWKKRRLDDLAAKQAVIDGLRQQIRDLKGDLKAWKMEKEAKDAQRGY